ncbi:hypothetical protein JCM33374_g4231 [Metschnikowia sp. JCM 33374]|nr:hypothetical protein JCM33374_g4231 [Metschnikowia sp. JCM 33374]
MNLWIVIMGQASEVFRFVDFAVGWLGYMPDQSHPSMAGTKRVRGRRTWRVKFVEWYGEEIIWEVFYVSSLKDESNLKHSIFIVPWFMRLKTIETPQAYGETGHVPCASTLEDLRY